MSCDWGAAGACMCYILQIIHVNLTSTEPVPLKDGEKVSFTFAVNWLPTVTPFKSRFERYLDYNFFEHKVRWSWCCPGSWCCV
jgi:hypothetical protein